MPIPSPSIHYRRRWFYVLWTALLLALLWGWALWERPKHIYEASLKVQYRARGEVPAGTRVQGWVGPAGRRPGADWQGEGGFVEAVLDGNNQIVLPVFKLHLAPRRWGRRAFIPRYTWDLLVLRITRPGQAPRYLSASLARDIDSGLLRPRQVVFYQFSLPIDALSLDPRVASSLP